MKLTPIAQAAGNTVPRPLNSQPPAEPVIFTAEEARRGYAMRGNTQHYCCYGMYCEAGHTSDCRYASGVKTCRCGQPPGTCSSCSGSRFTFGGPASRNDQQEQPR